MNHSLISNVFFSAVHLPLTDQQTLNEMERSSVSIIGTTRELNSSFFRLSLETIVVFDDAFVCLSSTYLRDYVRGEKK
jgi:hypothetical protein